MAAAALRYGLPRRRRWRTSRGGVEREPPPLQPRGGRGKAGARRWERKRWQCQSARRGVRERGPREFGLPRLPARDPAKILAEIPRRGSLSFPPLPPDPATGILHWLAHRQVCRPLSGWISWISDGLLSRFLHCVRIIEIGSLSINCDKIVFYTFLNVFRDFTIGIAIFLFGLL